MKKSLFISLAALFISLSAYSQLNDQNIKMGFVLSPQISWFNSDHENVTSGGSRFGYNFGLVLDRFFATNYAITTGLTINSTGGALKYNTVQPVTTTKQTYNLKYLEVPLAVKLKSSDNNRIVFNGQFGLNGMVNVKATDGNDNNINDEVRLLNFGYHFGGGVEYSLGGSTSLMFGLLYNNGLTDITKRNSYADRAVLNRLVFQIGVMF